MINHLTIIIPTYNRYKKLSRIIKYFDSVNFSPKIVILDSSIDKEQAGKIEILKCKHIQYYEFSDNICFFDKISKGIQEIKTPYAVLCADDDFISPFSIYKCIDFLETVHDYCSVHGRYMAFWIKDDKIVRIHPAYYHGRNLDIGSDDLDIRLKQYFSAYTPMFYSVCRTEILKLYA